MSGKRPVQLEESDFRDFRFQGKLRHLELQLGPCKPGVILESTYCLHSLSSNTF